MRSTVQTFFIALAGCVASVGAHATNTFADGTFDLVSPSFSGTALFEAAPASGIGPGGTKAGSFVSSPWFEDASGSSFSVSEKLVNGAAQSGSYFALLDGTARGSFGLSELVQNFQVDAGAVGSGQTAAYHVEFWAWGSGFISMFKPSDANDPYRSAGYGGSSRLELSNVVDVSNTHYSSNVLQTDGYGGSKLFINSTTSTNVDSAWHKYSFDVNNVADGSYNIYAVAKNSDTFAVDSFSVAEVPEPETYAMMLAGLATMGAVARRRKAQAKA